MDCLTLLGALAARSLFISMKLALFRLADLVLFMYDKVAADRGFTLGVCSNRVFIASIASLLMKDCLFDLEEWVFIIKLGESDLSINTDISSCDVHNSLKGDHDLLVTKKD